MTCVIPIQCIVRLLKLMPVIQIHCSSKCCSKCCYFAMCQSYCYVWEYFNCDVLKQEMCEINAQVANRTKQQLK